MRSGNQAYYLPAAKIVELLCGVDPATPVLIFINGESLAAEEPLSDDFWKIPKPTDCDNCGYKMHSNSVSALNNCNNCGKKRKACVYQPRLGEMCRINCPLWVPSSVSAAQDILSQ